MEILLLAHTNLGGFEKKNVCPSKIQRPLPWKTIHNEQHYVFFTKCTKAHETVNTEINDWQTKLNIIHECFKNNPKLKHENKQTT